MKNLSNRIDFNELLTRLVKYVFQALMVSLISYNLCDTTLSCRDLLIISITSASIFAIIDLINPSIK
jgi:hypothetical protein